MRAMGSYTRYGFDPPDWDEGACDGHQFSVQFARALSASELDRVAALFERGLARGAAKAAPQPWLWADRFALFTVGERFGSGFLRAVEHVLDDIHAFAPILDVLFLGAREEAVDAKPDAGPDFGVNASTAAYRRAVDPSLPPAAAIDSFERSRLRVREALIEERIAEVLRAEKRGQVGLQPTSMTPPEPKEPDLGPWLDLLERTKRVDEGWIRRQLVPHSSGDRCLLVQQYSVRELDGSGASRGLFTVEPGIESVGAAAYLYDLRVVVATDKRLRLFDLLPLSDQPRASQAVQN